MSQMRVFETVSEFLQWRQGVPMNSTMGFVPTMGALHAGHASLLHRSKAENDLSVLSIFVNPTQFNQPEDLANYPRTLEHDLATARDARVDVVFAPKTAAEMYPESYRYQMVEKRDSKLLCGEHRPGHFEGMLTIVLKLLQMVRADRAYFGEKDFQQLALIQGMVKAFFVATEIVPCETVRERDGLAMSSRNLRLTRDQRAVAPELHRLMISEKDPGAARKKLEELGFRVEYLEDRVLEERARRFAAAWLGDVRLIDNVPVPGDRA